MITFTITGLTMGVTVVMGQYMGEKKPEKVGQVVGGAICLFLALSFVIAAAMMVLARPLALLMQAPEAVVTAVLFSFIGYYNGHSKTLFVMLQGVAQTFIVRLPMSYFMSIQPDASLTMIGLAAPCATIFGIVINLIYFAKVSQDAIDRLEISG